MRSLLRFTWENGGYFFAMSKHLYAKWAISWRNISKVDGFEAFIARKLSICIGELQLLVASTISKPNEWNERANFRALIIFWSIFTHHCVISDEN